MPSIDSPADSGGSGVPGGADGPGNDDPGDPARPPSSGHGRLRPVLRMSVVPLFAALFPSVHYLERNLSNEALYPYVAPTPTAYALGGLAVLVGSAGIGLACGLFLYRVVVEPSVDERGVAADRDDPLFWRVLLSDARTLRVYLAFVAVIAVWAVVNLGGVGSESLATFLSFVVLPFGLPLLLLAPVAIASDVGVVVGYAACALWVALLARLFVELVVGIDGADRSLDAGETE